METGTDLYVVVYNALSTSRNEVMAIPVSRDATFEVFNVETNAKVDIALMPSSGNIGDSSSKYTLHFEANSIPPLGAVTFQIKMISTESSVVKASEANNTNLQSNVVQEWGYYTSYENSKESMIGKTSSRQESGAYIFRPSPRNADITPLEISGIETYSSPILTEIRTNYSNWVKQVERIYRGTSYTEIEYTVGPIPQGTEVVTRYISKISSNATFYTDSNGRDFIQRKLNYRPTWNLTQFQPVSGNYYPVNAAIFLEDFKSSLSVLTDRSQGGTSLKDGVIELMVQRRTNTDDSRGVGEPLDETDEGMTPYPPYGRAERKGKGVIITGAHMVQFRDVGNGASVSRAGMDLFFSHAQLFFMSSPAKLQETALPLLFLRPTFSLLPQQKPLPKNVMMVTYTKPYNDNRPGVFNIRLSHQYGKGEDDVLSQPVTIFFKDIFVTKVISVEEKTLTFNQNYDSREKKRLQWEHGLDVTKKLNKLTLKDDNYSVTLEPLEIRSFEVIVEVSVDFSMNV
mmetsp:Transcript_35433/g.82180  ORF Transcript_35433/g.82180 Transcript_35433/m.82180 type:complete len:513 (-) Transcript_35433:227-1765(-)